jgi:hypothetical protein
MPRRAPHRELAADLGRCDELSLPPEFQPLFRSTTSTQSFGSPLPSNHHRVDGFLALSLLHAERLRGRAKRLHRRNIDELPDGACAAFDGAAFAVRGDTLLRWTPEGYHARKPRPRRIAVDVLTPPAILAVLSGWL